MEGYNDVYKTRTKKFAVSVIKFYSNLKKTDEIRIIGKQLLKSSTSVAANFRAASRARSEAEFYSKLSIVVEEADETLFWFEIFEEAELVDKKILAPYMKESTELLSVFAKTRKNIKSKK